MKTVKVLPVVALAMFLMVSMVSASPQQAGAAQVATATDTITPTPTLTNPTDVVITSPVLVSELHGTVQVKGTADLTGMTNYVLETRPLNADASIPTDDVPWTPATQPSTAPVQDGVLA